MEKKDLERLFKDRFKDFQETPDERVWESIEASLDKKKKKRVVPIWWQLGGVAALLAILLFITNPFGGDTEIDDPAITETEQQKDSETINGEQIDAKENIDSSNSLPDSNELVESNATEDTQDKKANTDQHLKNNVPNVAQSALEQTQKNGQLASNDVKEVLVDNAENQKVLDFDTPKDSQETIAEVVDKVIDKPEDSDLKDIDPAEVTEAQVVEETLSESENDTAKKSIFDAIQEQEEENAVAKNSENRWSVGPAVAPVYFDGIGEGSPVHSNFSTNSKSGNVNLSYGLNVAYELNNRLSIRTGVHRVNYGYDTNDIVFSSSLDASTNQDIDNINYNEDSRGLVVESKASPSVEVADASSTADFVARTPEFEGRMVQQIGYMEVPLELNYALIDKRFGVNLIGGMSSLFLVDNSVSLETDGLVTEMGEANNVNDVNFSTNIGVGLNYKFSDKVRGNLEPVFKYQLNTFSNTAGDFRPFSVGVYSGLSFKF